jgi:sugar lactone lactonase YvrE
VRDSSGNFYTSNQSLNTVTKFSASSGTAIASYALGAGRTPYSLTIDSAGNLYTANYGNGGVSKITSTGTVTEMYTAAGSQPWGITADSSGNVYVTNSALNTVTKILSDGTVIPTFASLPNSSRPIDVTLDPAGNIYTANTLSSTVSKIAQSNLSATTGGAVTSAGNVGSGINGMAIDSTGNIYTSSYQNSTANAIYKIDNVSSPAFSLSSSSESVNLGSSLTGYNISGSALAISGFSISPSIGNGLSFSTSTGLISGTPQAAASAVTYTITGNSRSVWVSQTFTITVNATLVAQTITFPAISDAVVGSTTTSANATASSGINVLYRSNSNSVCTIFEGYWNTPGPMPITLLTVGTCSITASEEGDATYAPAADVTRTFNVRAAVNNNAAADAAAAAAKNAKEQKELLGILSLIPELGKLSLSVGDTALAANGQKCIKGKTVKYVKKSAKCPKGYVKK